MDVQNATDGIGAGTDHMIIGLTEQIKIYIHDIYITWGIRHHYQFPFLGFSHALELVLTASVVF